MSGFSEFIAFAVTARHGSFARAARELGITASTVAKRILRLEERLGVRLFHRTTRQVTLTSDGEMLYARCEKVLADIDDIESLASGTSGEPRGQLRINMPITYGKRVVMPKLARLLAQHPGLELDVRLSDSFCDLIRDGIDAAIRVGALDDTRLTARRIDWQHLVLCGSPAYLRRQGMPTHADQLEAHHFVVFRNPTSGRERPVQLQVDGKTQELHPETRVVINDGEGMVEAARHDAGLTQVPRVMAEDAIANGSLVEVLPACAPPPQPISLIWPGNRLLPARMRLLIETLAGLG
ncbi:LysR family transcriptional regulator [Noviherbaspirillum pedocola]|uniref:LysR family transcriptional regulator n=1 Tax=Noviherbaspirillum pedocola TaxID=2801341 RepID=A0A934T0V5_9BURK|nr:LysR family transcriptional regulator [Noviherbaspirillum pedocola]MBK4736499.1 LysR family transcriptional regulator [Noviherbaspirillum pedocola]